MNNDSSIDTTLRVEIIDGVLQKLRDYYVFPDVAMQMEEAVRLRLSNGEYDSITSGATLCETLTAHLREVSRDKHLRVLFSEQPRPTVPDEDRAARREEYRVASTLQNHGFHKVERLPGNIGYLDLRGFFSARLGGETAIAAMNFLADTSALIVDLRRNGGGDPEMVALITTYLFDKPVHLNSLYWREDDSTKQFWTLPYVPGKRYGADKPIYVLTSRNTFSGAEEFTYNLKNLKRATIIGEVTGGGAHPGDVYPINAHFAVWVPTGRAISPITGTNWEGTGVTPDIEVPQEQALQVAQVAALKQIIERFSDNATQPYRELVVEAREALEGESAKAREEEEEDHNS